MEKIVNWIKNNKVEFAILVAILAVGAFLRLYRIADYMTFLGDEGRDVIVVSRFIKYFDIMLIGPGTSIGNMYLGPLYYYMMALPLLIANFSPVGPAVMVALLGVATIAFIWWVGRKWFPASLKLRGASGLIAAGLYAISPTVIIYSRSSWNPNIMPFFSLLCVYSIWKVWKDHSFKWLVVLSVSFAFVLQSHYLGLLLLPTLGIYWFITFLRIKKDSNKENKKNFLRYSLFSVFLFSFLMSPLVIFDARHGWRNFSAMRKFFAVRQETVSIKPWKAIPKIFPIFEKINIRLLAGRNDFAGKTISFILVVFLFWLFVKRRKLTINHSSLTIVLTWFAFALLGLGLYKQEIYDHYYGFFFPAPFLLLGGIASQILNIKHKIFKIFFIFALLILILVNLQNSPFRSPPNQQLRRAKEVAQKVSEESNNKEFNFAVIAERNYESGYKYFLQMQGDKIVDIDAQKPDTITNQLFVVCEVPKDKCDPTHNPKAEVANFGWSKIEKEMTVFGTTLYKLVHTK